MKYICLTVLFLILSRVSCYAEIDLIYPYDQMGSKIGVNAGLHENYLVFSYNSFAWRNSVVVFDLRDSTYINIPLTNIELHTWLMTYDDGFLVVGEDVTTNPHVIRANLISYSGTLIFDTVLSAASITPFNFSTEKLNDSCYVFGNGDGIYKRCAGEGVTTLIAIPNYIDFVIDNDMNYYWLESDNGFLKTTKTTLQLDTIWSYSYGFRVGNGGDFATILPGGIWVVGANDAYRYISGNGTVIGSGSLTMSHDGIKGLVSNKGNRMFLFSYRNFAPPKGFYIEEIGIDAHIYEQEFYPYDFHELEPYLLSSTIVANDSTNLFVFTDGNSSTQNRTHIVGRRSNLCKDTITISVSSAHQELRFPEDSVVLHASNGFSGYLWNTGDTGRTIVVYDRGHYFVSSFEGVCPIKSDSFFVEEGYCKQPEQLYASDLKPYFARLNWLCEEPVQNYVVRGNQIGQNVPVILTLSQGCIDFRNVSGLTQSTSYWWQVRKICDQPPFSRWSVADTFTTPSCSVPDSVKASSITSNSVRLEWSNVQFNDGYQVRGKAIGSSNWITIDRPRNNRHFTTSRLDSNTSYHWQIRTVCSQNHAAYSDWSVLDTFSTPQFRVGYEYIPRETLNWRVSPTMLSGAENGLSLFSIGREKVIRSVWLFDLQGKSIPIRYQVFDEFSGIVNMSQEVKKGVYFLKIVGSNTHQTIKIIVSQ